MRKKKYPVCGYRFRIEKEAVYMAYIPRGIAEAFTPKEDLNVTDCHQCGCQIKLAPRLPAVKDITAFKPKCSCSMDEVEEETSL